jgi:hypothetical protein
VREARRRRSRANLRSRSRSAVGGYAVSVKAEPVEEHKESGIILDLTRCGQRLNNRAAILRSKIIVEEGRLPAPRSDCRSMGDRRPH